MRAKFIAGDFDAWTPEEKQAGLDYCETDVEALAKLLPAMLPKLDLQHALLRGRYSGPAVAAMQHVGVPIDVKTFRLVTDNWGSIIDELIAKIDSDYGVYEGRTFKEKRFEDYLTKHRIPWGRTAHGHLKLDDDTFSEMSKSFKILEPLRNLRYSLGTMRLNNLAIGHDGRNRVMLSQFASRTGRNQPSSAKFIFGPGVWLLADHKRIYQRYWQWSDLVQDHAALCGGLQTMFGWHVHSGPGTNSNPRSMRNFPIQGGCAEIMRLAACLATERGVPVCAPVHDAFLICSPLDKFEDDIRGMQACMAEAARAALGGFELQSDVRRVLHPDRYMDKRGKEMWETVMGIVKARHTMEAA
jgi:hypothetical protein